MNPNRSVARTTPSSWGLRVALVVLLLSVLATAEPRFESSMNEISSSPRSDGQSDENSKSGGHASSSRSEGRSPYDSSYAGGGVSPQPGSSSDNYHPAPGGNPASSDSKE